MRAKWKKKRMRRLKKKRRKMRQRSNVCVRRISSRRTFDMMNTKPLDYCHLGFHFQLS
ncbi:hypothetical protein YC2023_038374 [Brassica napus]